VCNVTGIAFGEAVLTKPMIAGRDVLEVGSLDVNGSLRPYVESLGPARYVGVDIAPGPRVDEVVDASKLVDRFGAAAFDVVLTTEMVEHIRDWRTVVRNLKRVVRPGGLLLVTTRSIGFPYADFEIVALERDTDAPGIFMLARKPTAFTEKLAPIALFSIVSHRRRADVSSIDILRFRLARRVRADARTAFGRAARELPRAPRKIRRRVIWPVWRSVPAPVQARIRALLGRGR
jgi:SAM-dependent methyltransferase